MLQTQMEKPRPGWTVAFLFCRSSAERSADPPINPTFAQGIARRETGVGKRL
jgi:hypothetical protein